MGCGLENYLQVFFRMYGIFVEFFILISSDEAYNTTELTAV
jgi:hypothetical protein